MNTQRKSGRLFGRIYLLFLGALLLGFATIMLGELIGRAEDLLLNYSRFCGSAFPIVLAFLAALLLIMLWLALGKRTGGR
jgi:hypothetical protein